MKLHLLSSISLAVAAAAGAAPYQDLGALDARIADMLPANVSAVPIDRRIKLAPCPEDPRISAPASGAVSVRCIALGWRIRVAVTGASGIADAPAPMLVHRGDAIELVARGSGYSVTSLGTALEEGPAGASIRVKIPTSSSPVAAVIERAGVASISY